VSGRFHLAWFLNFVTDDWRGPWGAARRDWASGDFYVEMGRDLERAGFDFMIIEDKLMVSDAYGGTMAADLKHGVNPKHDPVPLAVLVAQATSRLGVVATMSTSFYPPFLLARLCATVDHIARGRFGWNVVTSAEDRSAQNFGLDRLAEHDHRYEIATEYVDLVCRLWESWEADALVADRDAPLYVDAAKVHHVDFEGEHHRSRGPLNTLRPPYDRPVICQAGASPKGREFAARYADTIIATATSPVEMKAYRDDIRRRLEAIGRKPDDCKVLYLVSPIVGETHAEAVDKRERWLSDPTYIEHFLTQLSSITEIDFSRFDLDSPLPTVSTNGERGSLEAFAARGEGKPLRELVSGGKFDRSVELVGTPDEVADLMGEMMEQAGGDGFLVTSPVQRLDRRYVAEITDGLVPALQRRGLVRSGYTFEGFRHNLLEF
jgi:FMN-dependent oxidoreductase (nitrilotriacetate monooxygenase family)